MEGKKKLESGQNGRKKKKKKKCIFI